MRGAEQNTADSKRIARIAARELQNNSKRIARISSKN
jgi:hypothetical protein